MCVVHTHVCTVFTCVHVCEVRGWCQFAPSLTHPFIRLRQSLPHLTPELAEFHSLPSQLALGIPRLCHTHLAFMWVLGTATPILPLYPLSPLLQPLPFLFEAGEVGAASWWKGGYCLCASFGSEASRMSKTDTSLEKALASSLF